MGLVDVNNSRLSNTLGQGQGQSSTNDVRNAQNLSNYNPNTNYILFQPNNSPSISIGVNQNDSSVDKKSDVSSSTGGFTPSNPFTLGITGGAQGISQPSLTDFGRMINDKSSTLNMLLPTIASGVAVYSLAYYMGVPTYDAAIYGGSSRGKHNSG